MMSSARTLSPSSMVAWRSERKRTNTNRLAAPSTIAMTMAKTSVTLARMCGRVTKSLVCGVGAEQQREQGWSGAAEYQAPPFGGGQRSREREPDPVAGAGSAGEDGLAFAGDSGAVVGDVDRERAGG